MRRVCENHDGFIVQGEINFSNVVDLRLQGIAMIAKTQHSSICMDLSSVTRVDNVALALLTSWCKEAHKLNKTIVYKNLPVALENMASVFGVSFLFDKAPSECPVEKKISQENAFTEVNSQPFSPL
jgi:ABC-type transporter Mla MlaB component